MVKKEPIRQLIKFSNYSLCITLPKEYIDNLGWQQGDRVSFKLTNNKNDLILSREDSPKSETPKQPKGTQEIPKEPPKSATPPNPIQIEKKITYTREAEIAHPIITNDLIETQIIKKTPENFDNQDLEPIPPIS